MDTSAHVRLMQALIDRAHWAIHCSTSLSCTVGSYENEDLAEEYMAFGAMKNIEINMANSELIVPLRLNIGERLCIRL